MHRLESSGFDAAIKSRAEDHLHRWPFAQEIYGIATTGPNDWSVRIGVYGEWGTGKTSVLELVASMAKADDHVVVFFNPWEHSTKDSLWRAFVVSVYDHPNLCGVFGARRIRVKNRLGKVLGWTKPLETAASLLNEKGAKALGVGIDLLKSFFRLDAGDLTSLRDALGGKRVFVIVDDLDRTAPELVPEILFALKELMGIPGFSFICAFDPNVVGQVLGRFHPGFGDGLRFLEKVIDYPRWLPPPKEEDLADLAVANARVHCGYVPDRELRQVVSLLPPNPRSVRQFIRLLSLLGPQIKRHRDDELRWPAILAADIIKIRFPKLSDRLLGEIEFWSHFEMTDFTPESKRADSKKQSVSKHVDDALGDRGIILREDEKEELINLMLRVSENLSFLDGGAESLVYQMNLAEAPSAVTMAEFDNFQSRWQTDPTVALISTWTESQSDKVARSHTDVYAALLSASLRKYLGTLQKVDTVRSEEERGQALKDANTLASIIGSLVLEAGRPQHSNPTLKPYGVNRLFDTFANICRMGSSSIQTFTTKNEQILVSLIKRWAGDVGVLMDAVQPYSRFGSRRYDSEEALELQKRLSSVVLPRFASEVCAGFRQPAFVQAVWRESKDTQNLRGILLSEGGCLWRDKRQEFLAVLRDSGKSAFVAENAFDVLYWFKYLLEERGHTGDATSVKSILADEENIGALWGAATERRLNYIWTARLEGLRLSLHKSGIIVKLPPWWKEVLSWGAPTSQTTAPSPRTGDGQASES